MEIGVRDEWIDRVARTCRAFGEHAVPRRTRSARRLCAEFESQLPDPKSHAENVVLRAMLVEVSLRFGHADHWAYHAECPDAECAEDPAATSLMVWCRPPADAKGDFSKWSAGYLATMERVHPRYRAMELRRDLDADFARPLSLATLARTRGVTMRNLQRDFEELTGVTVREYVTERRLDAAVDLLGRTQDKVEWIANVVGWASRKNLNRALARRRGVNPGDIRAHAR